jgi:hypothetical protein
MNSLTAGNSRISKRVAAGLMALALAIAAPAALASSSSTSHGVVHTQVLRSGTVVVSGYDGGVPVSPGR